MERTRLRTNVIWMLIGNGCYAFMQWIQLSMLAKLRSSYELGSYTLALAITAPVFLFLGLQLRQMLVTDVKNEFFFADYYTLRIFSVIISLLVIIGYAIMNESDYLIVYFVAALKVIEGLAEVFNAKQQASERMKYVAFSLSLKGLSVTVCMFISIYFMQSLVLGLLFAVLSNIVILYVNDYRNCRKLISSENFVSLNGKRIKALVQKGLPLGIVMLLFSLNANIPKYMIEYFKGTELQGIYSTITYCLVLGLFITTALGQSFMPRMSQQYANGDYSEFKQLCGKYVLIIFFAGLMIFIVSLFFGKSILTILFSTRIADYHNLFTVVMFSGIIAYIASAMGYILSSMRIFKIQPYINGISLIVNIVCSYFLLKLFGLYGVVYASITSFMLQGLITGWIILRKRHPKPDYSI